MAKCNNSQLLGFNTENNTFLKKTQSEADFRMEKVTRKVTSCVLMPADCRLI